MQLKRGTASATTGLSQQLKWNPALRNENQKIRAPLALRLDSFLSWVASVVLTDGILVGQTTGDHRSEATQPEDESSRNESGARICWFELSVLDSIKVAATNQLWH